MPIIYTPKGAAEEYGKLAANLFNFCSFGCTYCYAKLLRRKKEIDVLGELEKDAAKLQAAGVKGNVFLCFTCDPYLEAERYSMITRRAIGILHAHGLNFTILTKAGELAQRDFDLYRDGDTFGVTLTLTSTEGTQKYEPNAALPFQRLENLKVAHALGIKTFVSCEPVLFPEATLMLIELSAPYVDIFRVGKLNHQEPPEPIDWKQFALDAIDLLEKLHKGYMIKKDLAKYLTAEVK
jgi:DNA repair photolyase